MTEPNLNLLQGTLDVLVLKALEEGARHGYAVAQWIREVTDDELQIEEGALYTALHRMERRRWLAAEWGTSESRRRARFYRLTAAGRRQLGSQSRRWSRYSDAVFKVLNAGEARG
jgi:transcriptional regulator